MGKWGKMPVWVIYFKKCLTTSCGKKQPLQTNSSCIRIQKTSTGFTWAKTTAKNPKIVGISSQLLSITKNDFMGMDKLWKWHKNINPCCTFTPRQKNGFSQPWKDEEQHKTWREELSFHCLRKSRRSMHNGLGNFFGHVIGP